MTSGYGQPCAAAQVPRAALAYGGHPGGAAEAAVGRAETTISYAEFSKQVDNADVTKIYAKRDAIQGRLKKAQDNPRVTPPTTSWTS
ncbi:hypothetical protein AQJ91_27785 [Streptomyces dysideae]|uniref:Uncharacterized protein n=1 Tax=Streptomyces dysideae TaxID=909626 RepID=A0A117RZL0_9ACTN|nr:hypothetical protein AQJ91_27785 [Streptomyces dysideae]